MRRYVRYMEIKDAPSFNFLLGGRALFIWANATLLGPKRSRAFCQEMSHVMKSPVVLAPNFGLPTQQFLRLTKVESSIRKINGEAFFLVTENALRKQNVRSTAVVLLLA